jgi:hypothetical protein
MANYPLRKSTVSALFESCPNLRAISIEFLETMEQSEIGIEGVNMGLSRGLSNLENMESLVLEELYGDISSWRDQIVDILSRSPSLQHLGLSLSTRTLSRTWWDERDRDFESSIPGSLDNLCIAYGVAGKEPLRLRTLQLGQTAYPHEVDLLQKLPDLSVLVSAEHSAWRR